MTEDFDRVLQTRAGRRVEYLSITWTSLEAIIGVTIGILAGSVALIGFGADSIIEVASSCVLLWWLAEGSIDCDRAAHRLVGRPAETGSAARHLLRHPLCGSVCSCHASFGAS